MIRVIVIIVTYNGMQWLPKCLDNLYNSKFPVDILIIDNNSQDDGVFFIKSNYPQVRLIELDKNIGFGKANNIGLKIAKEESYNYSFLLNQDGYVNDSTIEVLIDVAQRNSNYGILSPIHLDRTGNHLDQSFLYYLQADEKATVYLENLVLKKSLKEIYDFSMINAAAWLIPSKILEIVGGFNPIFFLYGEDDNYCQRVIFHKFKIGLVPQASFTHDSLNANKPNFEVGSTKYYGKFLNRFKVKYCNVLTSDHEKVALYRRQLLTMAIKSFFKSSFKKSMLNFEKYKLVAKTDFTKIVIEDRKIQPSYLKDDIL